MAWGAGNLLNFIYFEENVDFLTPDGHFIGAIPIFFLTKGA